MSSSKEHIYEKKTKNKKLSYGQEVKIKTKETLIKEGFTVSDQGVFKNGKMYLNQSDLEYLGWAMQVEFKDSEYRNDNKFKGYSLIVAGFGFCEVDMYNVEPCMFTILE